MKASVCVATKNAEHTIIDSLSSIQQQDFKDFEVIIVDDHSTDNTCNLINNLFCKKDSRFKLFVNCTDINKPYTDAYNKSYQFASGEYLIRFDHDDIMMSDHISTIIDFMDNNTDVDAVCTMIDFIRRNDNGELEKYDLDSDILFDTDKVDEFNNYPGYACNLNKYQWFNQSSCIRKNFYDKSNIKFTIYKTGDYIFLWNMFAKGAKIQKIKKITLSKLVDKSNLSSDFEFHNISNDCDFQILAARYKQMYFSKQDPNIVYPNGSTPVQMKQLFANTERFFINLKEKK